MTIVYRREKGASLTADEVDRNFAHLQQEIVALKAMVDGIKLPEPVSINRVGINISDGNTVLGVPCLYFHGKWSADKLYEPGSIVQHDDGLWLLINQALNPQKWNRDLWHCIFKYDSKLYQAPLSEPGDANAQP